MRGEKTFVWMAIAVLTISSTVLMSATASDEPVHSYVENLGPQSDSGTVFWTLEPSSMELYVLPGDSADIIITITNDPSSDTYWQSSSMGFGGYWGDYMDFYLGNPPLIAPGDSWTGSVGTVYVHPTTPYGTVCTAPGCGLDIGVFNGEPSWDFMLVTVTAAKRVRVQLTPESGPVGTEVTITGVDALPNSSMEIYWDNAYMGTVVADENGNFAYTLAVPPSTRDVHTITAVDPTAGISDTQAFTVLSTISTTPVSGPMGTKVQVSGLGFGANEHVVLTFEDMQIAEINTTSSGSFTATFNIPLALNGEYRVKAWYGPDCVEAIFTVTEVSELDVTIDVGAMYFKGETAEFYVQTAFNGKPTDVTTMNAQLYMPDGTTTALTYNRIATGLYKILFTISGKGSMIGTYTVVVEATQSSSALDAYGTSIRTFIVKPTWERELPKMAALSIASIGLIGSMFVLWKKEKKRYL